MSFAVIDYNSQNRCYHIKKSSELDELNIFLPRFKEKKSIRYARKVLKILNEAQINTIVMNKNLIENNDFCYVLTNNKKNIITGRKIYKVLIPRMLKDIAKQMKINLARLKIALLINEYSVENIDLIRNVAKEVKTLIIFTSDKEKFKNIVEELFEKYGIILKVYEKNRNNLKYAHIIINVDLSGDEMNKIKFANNSAIICGFAENYQLKTNFQGILIRKIDVISNYECSSRIDEMSLCEARIYSYFRKIKENDRAFERNGYRINGFLGENGKITSEDFQKLGKIILDK